MFSGKRPCSLHAHDQSNSPSSRPPSALWRPAQHFVRPPATCPHLARPPGDLRCVVHCTQCALSNDTYGESDGIVANAPVPQEHTRLQDHATLKAHALDCVFELSLHLHIRHHGGGRAAAGRYEDHLGNSSACSHCAALQAVAPGCCSRLLLQAATPGCCSWLLLQVAAAQSRPRKKA
jgi:hypothetical protein